MRATAWTSAAECFNYDYPTKEFIDIAAKVERFAPKSFTTHVIMNNNWEDQGQRNAAMLMQVLADRRKALVPRLQLPADH